MSNSIKQSTDSAEQDMASPAAIKQIPLNIFSGMLSGMFTGVGIAGIFHPWDRALFLSVSNKRPFLYDRQYHRFVTENFVKPYHGFLQTVASRTIANSIYFVAQSQMNASLYPYLRKNLNLYEWQAQLGVGLCVGSMTGATTNGLYAVRFQTWNNPGSTFVSSARHMWLEGGVAPFLKGIYATMCRDVTFSIVYEVLRHWGQDNSVQDNPYQFIYNLGAGGVATIFSGPLNYVRNIQYATPPYSQPPGIRKVIREVLQESKSHPSTLSRLSFFHQRFQVGWGTARVAVGMAIGQELFKAIHAVFSEYLAVNESKNSLTKK